MRVSVPLIVVLFLLFLSCSPAKRDKSTKQTSYKLYYTGFTVQYNSVNRQPDWVEYTLTAEQVFITDNTLSTSHKFKQDPKLQLPQASDADYKGISKKYGLSRGHMARRQDMKWSSQAVEESDYYTNICPQNETLNKGLWKKNEDLVREMAKQYDSVHVVCGPIFTNTAYGYIGPSRIPVPDYFFKTLLIKDCSGYHAIAFLCPNNGVSCIMNSVQCTVDKVESMAKIDIYSYLPDNIESIVEGS